MREKRPVDSQEHSTSNRLLQVISECVAEVDPEGAGIVTGFVVIASYMTAEGERNIFSDTAVDQRNHETLGLLAWATAVETKRVQDIVTEEDD